MHLPLIKKKRTFHLMIPFALDELEIVYLHPTLKLFLKTKNPSEMSFHLFFCIHTSNEPEGES